MCDNEKPVHPTQSAIAKMMSVRDTPLISGNGAEIIGTLTS